MKPRQWPKAGFGPGAPVAELRLIYNFQPPRLGTGAVPAPGMVSGVAWGQAAAAGDTGVTSVGLC